MRLDRFLTQAAMLTRSQAKIVLRSGRVTINGDVTKSASLKVSDTDDVCLDENVLSLPTLSYLMLHKPAGYVCANEDPEHPTVFDLLPFELAQSPLGVMHCAGRLDRDTTGLVLITDDGQWSHRVTSPNYASYKRYQVDLAEPVDDIEAMIRIFKDGIQLKGETKLTQPAELSFNTPTEAELCILEGRYHQVKRMFAAVGNHVVSLHRDRVGEVSLETSLEEGSYRHLTDSEMASFLTEASTDVADVS